MVMLVVLAALFLKRLLLYDVSLESRSLSPPPPLPESILAALRAFTGDFGGDRARKGEPKTLVFVVKKACPVARARRLVVHSSPLSEMTYVGALWLRFFVYKPDQKQVQNQTRTDVKHV